MIQVRIVRRGSVVFEFYHHILQPRSSGFFLGLLPYEAFSTTIVSVLILDFYRLGVFHLSTLELRKTIARVVLIPKQGEFARPDGD